MSYRIWSESPTIGEYLISGGHRLVSDANLYESRLGNEFKSKEELTNYCNKALVSRKFFTYNSSIDKYKHYCTLNMGEALDEMGLKKETQYKKISTDHQQMTKYIKEFNTDKKQKLDNWCNENFKIHYSHINTLTETLMREWCYLPSIKK